MGAWHRNCNIWRFFIGFAKVGWRWKRGKMGQRFQTPVLSLWNLFHVISMDLGTSSLLWHLWKELKQTTIETMSRTIAIALAFTFRGPNFGTKKHRWKRWWKKPLRQISPIDEHIHIYHTIETIKQTHTKPMTNIAHCHKIETNETDIQSQ